MLGRPAQDDHTWSVFPFWYTLSALVGCHRSLAIAPAARRSTSLNGWSAGEVAGTSSPAGGRKSHAERSIWRDALGVCSRRCHAGAFRQHQSPAVTSRVAACARSLTSACQIHRDLGGADHRRPPARSPLPVVTHRPPPPPAAAPARPAPAAAVLGGRVVDARWRHRGGSEGRVGRMADSTRRTFVRIAAGWFAFYMLAAGVGSSLGTGGVTAAIIRSVRSAT